MRMNVHLNFSGNAEEAFGFYTGVFGTEKPFLMRYSEAPGGAPVPESWGGKGMHTSVPLGDSLLMGCDAPPGRGTPIGGFQVSVELKAEADARRIYEA
jgi:PhnB protein